MLVLTLTDLMSILQPLVILFKKIFLYLMILFLICGLLKPFHVKTLCLIKLLFMHYAPTAHLFQTIFFLFFFLGGNGQFGSSIYKN